MVRSKSFRAEDFWCGGLNSILANGSFTVPTSWQSLAGAAKGSKSGGALVVLGSSVNCTVLTTFCFSFDLNVKPPICVPDFSKWNSREYERPQATLKVSSEPGLSCHLLTCFSKARNLSNRARF